MAQEKSAEGTLTAPADLLPPLRRVGGIEQGALRLVWNGHAHTLGDERPGPRGELHVNRSLRLARKLAVNGEIGFAEGYMDGDWDTPDLAALLLALARNERAFAALGSGSLLHRAATWLRHRFNRNSKGGSRRNIAYHYDLGNDFYRLWLDLGMTYSSALYQTHDEALESAQERKYARLLGLLDAKPGEHVLEIGCGWGGMALRLARAGLRVTALTLSQEQLAYARAQIDRAGLADRVEVRLQDYREVRGNFDHVVSIEMFEAVGEAYWPQYMETLAHCLRPGGRAALQVITIDERYFDGYRARPDFIQRYIFPGGMLPSPERFEQAASGAGLAVTERSFHGGDYARTLADWHERFVDQAGAIDALGFDQRFQRMWRYYLAYCEAGFRDGRIDLMQVRLEKPAG